LIISNQFKVNKDKEGSKMAAKDILMAILAILLPPLAVFLLKGCGKDLLINVILCCFVWIPGIIHALWVTCGGSSASSSLG